MVQLKFDPQLQIKFKLIVDKSVANESFIFQIRINIEVGQI